MNQLPTTLCLSAAFSATLVAFGLGWVARWLAPKIGVVDTPDGRRKLQCHPIPLMGGVALYAAFVAIFLLVDWIFNLSASYPAVFIPALLLTAGGLCLLGLVDDIWAIFPRHKLYLQFIICLPFVIFCRSIDGIELLGIRWELGLTAGTIFTVFWLVGSANAINLLDGADGVASTVVIVASIAIAALAFFAGNTVVVAMSVALGGATIGFLIHNWPSARLYMGDSGSLTTGFLIGALAIEPNLIDTTVLMIAAPFTILAVPVMDTFMAIVRRMVQQRGIGDPDLGHLHHCLAKRGLTKTRTVLVVSGLSFITAITAVVSNYARADAIAVLVLFAGMTAMVATGLFGRYETDLVLVNVREFLLRFSRIVKPQRETHAILRFREANQDSKLAFFDHLFEQGVERMDFSCFKPKNNELLSSVRWGIANTPNDLPETWQFHRSATRDEGVCVSVIASSGKILDKSAQDYLSQLIEVLLAEWPIDQTVHEVRDADYALPNRVARAA